MVLALIDNRHLEGAVIELDQLRGVKWMQWPPRGKYVAVEGRLAMRVLGGTLTHRTWPA